LKKLSPGLVVPMFRALLCFSLTFGVDVESVRLQNGMTHIVNSYLVKHAPIPVGSQPLGAGGLVASISSVEVSKMKVGNMTLAAGVDPLTKTNAARKLFDLALDTLKFNITDATFSIKAAVATKSNGTKSVTADATATKLSVLLNAPDRVGKIGKISGTCGSQFSIGAVEGLSGGEEEEVQNALESMMNRLVCFGGAPDAGLPFDFGRTGVEGFLNSTAPFVIMAIINPNIVNATERATTLTDSVNNFIPESRKIPNQEFGVFGFGLKDISLENTRVGEVQFYQTLFAPMMANGEGTYVKTEIKGVHSTVKFTLTTDIGDVPATLDVTSSDSALAFNFARDKNDFLTTPTVDCNIKFGFTLDVPAANWNPMWRMFLKGFDPVLSKAIEEKMCALIKSTTKTMLGKQILVPGAEVWDHVNEHVNDEVFKIDDNLFPLFKPTWWKNFTDGAIPALPTPTVGAEKRLQRLSGL